MATLPVKSKRTMGVGAVGPARPAAHASPLRLRRWAMTFSAAALTPVDSGQPM